MDEKFNMPRCLMKKRDRGKLSREEIVAFVKGAVDGSVTLDQVGAMLMAMYLNGVSQDETVSLTEALLHSGEVLEWSCLGDDKAKVVDKHSTGGVGDKVSIPLAPALMACGCKVPMISGRGLGHTGGTLDKLESIPNFNVFQPPEKMKELLMTEGGCMVGQSKTLVPGDRILYATRDVTSTVTSIPLIVASIMSKKIAEAPAALILDVKVGSGAFMKTREDAQDLAERMVFVGQQLGIKTVALMTEMDCPIGLMVGNALEMAESIDCMKGKGPADLEELVCAEGGHLLALVGQAADSKEGYEKIRTSLHDGTALEEFRKLASSHGASDQDARALVTDHWKVLKKADHQTDFNTKAAGYVKHIEAMPIAIVSGNLGAGRKRQIDPVDHAVGIELLVQRGDKVEAGQPWVRVHHNSPIDKVDIERLQGSLILSDDEVSLPSRLIKVIGDAAK